MSDIQTQFDRLSITINQHNYYNCSDIKLGDFRQILSPQPPKKNFLTFMLTLMVKLSRPFVTAYKLFTASP